VLDVDFSGDNGTITLWDYKTGLPFQNMEDVPQPGSLDAEAGVFCSTFDQTGTRLITGGADKTIKVCTSFLVSYNDDSNLWFDRFMRSKLNDRMGLCSFVDGTHIILHMLYNQAACSALEDHDLLRIVMLDADNQRSLGKPQMTPIEFSLCGNKMW
jgi:hypothetical protein